jgi:myo-inositol catabolism protein IolC
MSTSLNAAEETTASNINHELAEALFKLLLNLKALVAVTGDDRSIARLCGVPDHGPPLQAHALAVVRDIGSSLIRTSNNQLVKCFRIIHEAGSGHDLRSPLRVIRHLLETAADHVRSRPFTNDRRMRAAQLFMEACDICGLAIRNIAGRT